MKQLKYIIEGLLDIDDLEASLTDNVNANYFVDIFKNIVQKNKIDNTSMDDIGQMIRSVNKTDVDPKTIMRKLKEKDNTAIIYYDHYLQSKDPVIEIRAFVKNPRPYRCIIQKFEKEWRFAGIEKCNPITILNRNVANSIIFLNAEAWNDIILPKFTKFSR